MTDLMPAETGTRTLFGKPYHWTLTDTGLQIVAGEAPEDDEAAT